LEGRGLKRPDLLILIAIWQFVVAALCLVGIVAIGIFAFPSVSHISGIFGLTVAVVALAVVLGVGVAGGVGLLLGKEWGRILSIVHGALSLFNFPIGTVVGVLAMVYLVRPEVREYFSSRSA
jgi:hypothetical protein